MGGMSKDEMQNAYKHEYCWKDFADKTSKYDLPEFDKPIMIEGWTKQDGEKIEFNN